MSSTTDSPTRFDSPALELPIRREQFGRGWQASHDRAVDCFEQTRAFCPLSFDEWSSLVSSVESGLPIELTWTTNLGGYENDRIQTTRAMCIVDSIQSLAHNHADGLRVRYCGFAHGITLRDLKSARIPSADYTFSTRERSS